MNRRTLVLASLLFILLSILHPVPGQDYDFCTYYTAGLLLNEDLAPDAYGYDSINLRHNRFHASEKTGPFLYSPLYLLPAALMAKLSYDAAETLNHWLILAALVALFTLLQKRIRPPLDLILMGVFLTSHMVLSQFLYQNWTALLALQLAIAWELTLRKREWSASLMWALTLHLKSYMLFFLVPLWLSGRKKTVYLTLLWSFLLGAVTIPFTGFGAFTAYAGAISKASVGITAYFNQVSLGPAFARFTLAPDQWIRPDGPVLIPFISDLFLLSIPLFFLFLLFTRVDLHCRLAVTTIYLLLFIPHTWDHMMILLLLCFPLLPLSLFLLLSLLFSLTFFYDDTVHTLLYRTLVEGLSPSALTLFLFIFPFTSILTLLGILKRGKNPDSLSR